MADRSRALPERLEALDAAVGLADGRLDDDLVARARAVLGKAHERLARGPATVVVALGGGTGSGKSSLFNALAGTDLSRVGAVRPVTGEVIALAIGENEGAGPVLDWLGVRRRHAAPDGALSEGLVLLDLPDHDSVEMEHREVVDRFVERVDVLVWVVDPLKYAQRALHDGYLRLLAAHARVVLIVLNQADRLGTEARAAVLLDLRRLLNDQGLNKARILSTSARTGEGIDGLRATINDYVVQRRAVAQRIAGDLGNVAGALATQVGPPISVKLDAGVLAGALANAAGVEHLADAGRRSYVDDANDASRPAVTAAVAKRVRKFRNPMRRLKRPAGVQRQDASPVAVRHAVLALADGAARELPHPWPQRLHVAGQAAAADLPSAVSKGLDRVDVHDVGRRHWWRAFGLLGTLVETAALIGLLWLLALGVLGWFQIPLPPMPRWRDIPYPTLLSIGGLLLYVIIGFVRRRLVAVGAARHAARMRKQLEAAVAVAAEERALQPLRAELDAHAALARHLRTAAGRPL